MGARVSSTVTLVKGKKTEPIEAAILRQDAAAFRRLVIDIGAGDGRFAYRLARAHQDTLVLAVDASAEAVRAMSWRAGRKPSRGGAPNVRYIRAAVECLPDALNALAHEVHILYPWGSLLRALVIPDRAVISRIARLGQSGATLRIVIDSTILDDRELRARLGLPSLNASDVAARLLPAYAEEAIHLTDWARRHDDTRTSWRRRLGQGRPVEVMEIRGVIRASCPARVGRNGAR